MENQFQISDLARQVGVATSAVRYYEEVGLLPPAARNENGYRVYTRADVERLGFIQRARTLDFGLEISDLEWNFRYYPLEFNDFFVQIRRMGNRLFIDDFQGSVGESNLKMSASLENFTDTVFENTTTGVLFHAQCHPRLLL